MESFELLIEDDVLAGEEEGRGEEVILVGLFAVALLFEVPFEFFEVFIEHVLPAEFGPASEVVDFGVGVESVFFEDPVDLLFFAPHNIPIIGVDFLPVACGHGLVDGVSEGGFKLDKGAG